MKRIIKLIDKTIQEKKDQFTKTTAKVVNQDIEELINYIRKLERAKEILTTESNEFKKSEPISWDNLSEVKETSYLQNLKERWHNTTRGYFR